MMRMAAYCLLTAGLLAGCGPGGRYDDIDNCNQLVSAFESEDVPDTAQGRKELGDEYRARFRELDCEL